MYKCVECGNLFEEGEEKTWKEDRGEYWGAPCYEDVSGCPVCGGGYEEVIPCRMCGSYEHMHEGDIICSECVEENFENE